MKSYVVFYKMVGAMGVMQAKRVEAVDIVDAGAKVVREMPNAIVWGFPREVEFFPAPHPSVALRVRPVDLWSRSRSR
jgi:hypothetical protein